MPYLDYLSDQEIRANPYSIFQSVAQVFQGGIEPSGLLVEFLEAGLKRIGERYVAYLNANESLRCLDHVLFADRLYPALLTLLDQHFAMAISPEKFGNAIQSEASAMVIDRFLGSTLGKDVGVSFHYRQFTQSTIGSESFVRAQMHKGLYDAPLMNALRSHWIRYLQAACFNSHELQKSKSLAKTILNELFS